MSCLVFVFSWLPSHKSWVFCAKCSCKLRRFAENIQRRSFYTKAYCNSVADNGLLPVTNVTSVPTRTTLGWTSDNIQPSLTATAESKLRLTRYELVGKQDRKCNINEFWYFADGASQYIYLNINQLDALNFLMNLFHASTRFEHKCSSSGSQHFTIQSLWYQRLYSTILASWRWVLVLETCRGMK